MPEPLLLPADNIFLCFYQKNEMFDFFVEMLPLASELCTWLSALVPLDVDVANAPRFATSDSAAILSWIGWL